MKENMNNNGFEIVNKFGYYSETYQRPYGMEVNKFGQ